ncbi:MAG TPA: collagen-like protein, partial [Wolbachia sp.]|nr:collagen-like protein [Wolbachia sp.]
GLPGTEGIQGNKGDIGPQGDMGLSGTPGLKGDIGPQGEKGDVGLPGTEGIQGNKGDIGPQGVPGMSGLPGIPGVKGDIGPRGADGVGAAEVERFLLSMNQTKLEIQNAKEAVEVAKNASEVFAKKAQDARNETIKLHAAVVNLNNITEVIKKDAEGFARRASQSMQNAEAFFGKTKNIFCKKEPTDPVCPVRRRKRETENLNNQPVTSGAGSLSSSSWINIFANTIANTVRSAFQFISSSSKPTIPSKAVITQGTDINALYITTRFEKVLKCAAVKSGISSKNLRFNPIELHTAIVDKSFSDDELLEFLCTAAKESCLNCKQTDECLAAFKDHMKEVLKNNEQKRGFINIEKIATDNEQPGNVMSDIAISGFSSINQSAVVGYLT